MKTLSICLMFLAILLVHDQAYAGDNNFESSADAISKKLASPRSKFSFQISGEAQGVKKMRSIEVVEEDGGQLVKKSVFIFEDRPASSVNLKVEFDVNSYTIRKSSFPLLDELAKALLSDDLKTAKILVKGHTDSDGDEAMNLELSCKRAMSVKAYLVEKHQITEERMKSVGYGKALPLVENVNEQNKQLNRRVEIESIR